MKKLPILIYTLVLAALLSSCKKGEDDPFISFKSRKARVEGNWKMESGTVEITIKSSSGVDSTELYTFSESKFKFDKVGTGSSYEGESSLKLFCTKKGAFTLEQQIGGYIMKGSGTWDFLGRVGEAKNKERISFKLTTTNNASFFYDTFNKTLMNFNYTIKELRSKYMVLVCKEEKVFAENNRSIIITAEYVFVQ